MNKIIFIFIIIQSFSINAIIYNDEATILRLDEMRRFEYRAMTDYQLLDDEDFETIDAYYNLLFSISDTKQILDQDTQKGLSFLIKFLEYALLQNKLPKKYFYKIRSYSIALSGFNNGKDFFFNTTKLLWILEYRSFDEEDSANDFLKQSFNYKNKDRNKNILEVLKVDNKYTLIEQWFGAKSIKDFPQVIEILRRQYKIDKAFKNEQENAVDLLLQDYQLTIKQVFSLFDSNELVSIDLLYEHNDWLFLQFHKYKDFPRIKESLVEIYNDWLTYSEGSLVDKLPNEHTMGNKYNILRTINIKLNIYWKIQEINKRVLKQPVRVRYEHELKLDEKNKEFINKKLKIVK